MSPLRQSLIASGSVKPTPRATSVTADPSAIKRRHEADHGTLPTATRNALRILQQSMQRPSGRA